METDEITIRVNPDAAIAYRSASEEERHKLDALLSLRITDATRSKESLTQIMREISQQAQARGVTPEILRAILDDR
jgi:hypothetical protein